jgi:hypothetical protein
MASRSLSTEISAVPTPWTMLTRRLCACLQGAEEMGQMEHLLNVYVSRAAKGSCADFLGYCEVPDREATMRLTAGLWLVRLLVHDATASVPLLQPTRGCTKPLETIASTFACQQDGAHSCPAAQQAFACAPRRPAPHQRCALLLRAPRSCGATRAGARCPTT